jgi:hypothetical protein
MGDQDHENTSSSSKSGASSNETNSGESDNDSEHNSDSTPTGVSQTVDGNKDVPAILDGRYFAISKKIDGIKLLAKCQLCPNKLLSARINSTSNLLKHLKVRRYCKIYRPTALSV